MASSISGPRFAEPELEVADALTAPARADAADVRKLATPAAAAPRSKR
jgi:hypothetical protein